MRLSGLIYDLRESDYRANPAVSQSVLKEYAKTPAHGRAYELGEREVKSSAFNFGSAAHRAVLEPMLFQESVVIAPELNKNTKEYKAWKELQTGKLIIDSEDRDAICKIVMNTRSHPMAGLLLGKGKSEVSAFSEMIALWTDSRTNQVQDAIIPVKARFDWVHDVDGIAPCIVDVKTTDDASKEGFAKSIAKFSYHIQAAFYLDIANQCGYQAETFKIIAVEKEPPYAVAVYTLSSLAIQKGREEYQRLLGTYAFARQFNQYDAYSEDDLIIDLPAWFGKAA